VSLIMIQLYSYKQFTFMLLQLTCKWQ